jgi:hypothetical protein
MVVLVYLHGLQELVRQILMQVRRGTTPQLVIQNGMTVLIGISLINQKITQSLMLLYLEAVAVHRAVAAQGV